MNYRHSYHAGSIADVFKHLVLILLIEALHKKDKPFCYFDTHAGAAYYDLCGEEAQKTGEAQSGIQRLWELNNLPPQFQTYRNIIRQLNQQLANDADTLRFYPGSPSIANALLRAQDRSLLIELQADIQQQLRAAFKHNPQIHIHHMDGYLALKALLPVVEKRGLVFIDPPYEQANEFDTLEEKLLQAYARANTLIYAIWYPIKELTRIKKFHQNLQNSAIPKLLVTEFCFLPSDQTQRLNGSGMLIINPPWQIDKQITALLQQLPEALAIRDLPENKITWLKNI